MSHVESARLQPCNSAATIPFTGTNGADRLVEFAEDGQVAFVCAVDVPRDDRMERRREQQLTEVPCNIVQEGP